MSDTKELLDPQSEWARLLVASLADAGVTEVVNSPGSRSTPFLLAAAAERRLRVTSIIDERDAAFFAVGQAKASGRPSLLLCTSGSAPAHYLPAILEARATRTPLLVLSADRPLETQGGAAPQTCDQVKLYGDAALRFFELGSIDAAPTALRGLRRIAAQAVATAISPGGVVHLNVRARKPLEPHPASEAERATSQAIRDARAWPLPRFASSASSVDRDGLARLATLIAETPDGVIVAGPTAYDPIPLRALAQRAGYPLLVEATGAHDGCEVGSLALLGAGSLGGLQPRLVLQLGTAPVTAAYARLVTCAHHVEIVAAHADADAENRATGVLIGDPAVACVALEAALAVRSVDRSRTRGSSFARRWTDALERARAAMPKLAGTSELACVRATLDALPAVPLFVGNSLPVREVDLACALGARVPSLVFHQRGTSGIDGLVAGAAGVASIVGTTVLLLGDVSLLHDLHGLLVAATQPLAVVVLQNGGGRIFDTLPIGRREDLATERRFLTTSQKVDLAALARFAGVAYAQTSAANEIEPQLSAALARPGATLIELVVDPHSAAAFDVALVPIAERAIAEATS